MALIAETPFQLLNCVNLAMSHSNDDLDIDLYLGNRFATFSEVLNRLIKICGKYHMFHEIIPYSYNNIDKSCVINPRVFFDQCIVEYEKKPNHIYAFLYTSVVTRMTIALMRLNPKCKLFFYDDGLGSYYGEINLFNLSASLKVLLLLTGCFKKILYPSALYLNNASLCDSEIKTSVKSLPPLNFENEKYNRIYSQLFGNIPSSYSDFRTIFLTQPCDAKDVSTQKCYLENTNNILESLPKKKFILRLHPRDNNDYDTKYVTDKKGVLWEYICGKIIGDMSILITQFSTAAFSPKFFFDKEPTIIFTCYLYEKDVFYSDFSLIEKQIDKLRGIYRNPSKIYTPKNILEFSKIISELC